MPVGAVLDRAPTPVVSQLPHKQLIDEPLWERIVRRIVKNHGVERDLAERILDQALAYLTLRARDPEDLYSPSRLVDIGWHAFMLYSRPYAAWCKQELRRYWWQELRGLRHLRNWRPSNLLRLWRHWQYTTIHHSPQDEPGVVYTTSIARTVEKMREYGIAIDEELWDITMRAGGPEDDDDTEDEEEGYPPVPETGGPDPSCQ